MNAYFSRVLVPLVILAVCACGPRATPDGPGTGPASQAAAALPKAPAPRPPAREMLLAEMCPAAASGRPAIVPVFARRLRWLVEPDDVAAPLRQRVRQFSVLGWKGGRAGVFSVAGVAEVGLDRPVAIGAFAGRSPCSPPGKDGKGIVNRDCQEAQEACGLAFAVLEPAGGFRARPFGEDPEPARVPVGGGCTSGANLLVDIDGDGRAEAWPIAQFINEVREPASEVTRINTDTSGTAQCEPTFALRHVSPPGNPKHWRGMDLLGVLDVDGDGRMELVLVYHYADRRTWAIYSAVSTAARLELVGESVPWPRR